MAVNVNPPPTLRIPRAFLQDGEVRSFIEQQNTIIFQLWQRLGGSNDVIVDLENFGINGFSAITQQLQKEMRGLPEFTIDTGGFTTDTSLITTDKVIA